MAFSMFRKKKEQPTNMLPPGWQFFSRPNNIEPPGTIFRIDSEGTKYVVERLKFAIENSPEPSMTSVEQIQTKVGVLARLLGILPFNAQVDGGKKKTIEFEIVNPIRGSTTDAQINKVLGPYLGQMDFKVNNKYFIIREFRSATAMKYRLSNELIGEIGGEAAIASVGNVNLAISSKKAGYNELTQDFPERLGIMFLPEEIAPVRQGLAGGAIELGRLPVNGVLDWTEPDK